MNSFKNKSYERIYFSLMNGPAVAGRKNRKNTSSLNSISGIIAKGDY